MSDTDTLTKILARCRFVHSERELERTLPGVRGAIPPLQVVGYKNATKPTHHAYPVVPSPPLIERMVEFVATESERLHGGLGMEAAVSTDVDDLQKEPYFATLAELLAQTRAHGTVFRLDSVLWIHLSKIIAATLNPTGDLRTRMREISPGVRDSWLTTIEDACGSATDQELGVIQRRRGILQALVSRNELANRTISHMVGDARPNPLHTAMATNRLALALPPGFLADMQPRALLAVKDYGLSPKVVEQLIDALRAVIEDLYQHRGDRALSGTERFFITQFFGAEEVEHARALGLGGLPGHGDVDGDDAASLSFKLGWSLVFRDEVLRYLLSHLEQINSRRALTGQLGRYSKAFLAELEAPVELRKDEARILTLARDLRALDFFDALHGLQVDVEERRGGYFHGADELRKSSVPVDLGSYYELFRRNRSGTAVFVDLIGFTAKTRELFFSTSKASVAGDVELHERGELAALALERLFRVRQELGEFGGKPEGFEGDAILDILPDALSALRYVARFSESYAENRRIQFRPFSRPVANPFAQEGFRVGIATGEYTLVNVPDRAETGEATVRLRAIGPTINRASRLNSGKRGGDAFLSARGEEVRAEESDPLGLFEVTVREEVLNNTGICIDRSTFSELREMVRRERLPHWLRGTDMTLEVGGRSAVPAYYRFELLFRDPETDSVFAVRRLTSVPKLKGIERSDSVVFEVKVYREEDYLDFLRRDERAAATNPGGASPVTGSWETPPPPQPAMPEEHLAAELPDYMYERSHGRPKNKAGTSDTFVGAEPAQQPKAPVVEEAPPGAPPSVLQALTNDEPVSLEREAAGSDVEESGGLDSSLEQWALGEEGHLAASTADGSVADAPLAGGSESGDPEEDLDDDELQAYLTDFLNKFEGMEDEEESAGEDSGGPAGDEALFVPFASDGVSSDPDEVPGDGPGKAAPGPPAGEAPVGPPATAPTPPPFGGVAVEPSEESLTAPASRESESLSWPPPDGQAWGEESPLPASDGPDPLPPPPGPESLLGVLDDAFAAQVRDLLKPATPPEKIEAPVVPPPRDPPRTDKLDPLARPDLEQLLTDYYMVVCGSGSSTEVWIGRLFREKLFDLHRYPISPAMGGGIDIDQVLELFLRDKIDENFLTFGTRFESIPEEGSAPVPLPVDQAERVLEALL